MTDVDQEALRDKFMQFQTLQQHIEQISQHVEQLNQQVAEIENSKEAVKEFADSENDSEILAPMANGIFIKTKLIENQKLLVNVGADTVVERTVDEVVKLLQERQDETVKQIGQAQELLQDFHQQAMGIYHEVESMN
jgi:prefoldin alpha subunit